MDPTVDEYGNPTDTTTYGDTGAGGSMWGDPAPPPPDYGSAPTPVDSGGGGGGGSVDTSGGGGGGSTGTSGGGGGAGGGGGTSGWFDTNTYDYSQPADFSVGGNTPYGNWSGYDAATAANTQYMNTPFNGGSQNLTPAQMDAQYQHLVDLYTLPGPRQGYYNPDTGIARGQGDPGGMTLTTAPVPMTSGPGPAAGGARPPIYHAAMIPGLTGPDTGVPTSQNGQSLFDQDEQTQQMFQGTYGDQAAAEWARENDASLSASLPQGAQLPADALPGRNDQTTVPGQRPEVNSGTGQGQPPNMAGAPTPAAPGAVPPGQGAVGTHQVVTPDGKVLNLSDEGYAAYNRSLEAANAAANAERTYKQGQDTLANQRADKALDIQKIRDAGQAAYQNALAASRDREVANQAAYQAAQVELERQRVEMQNQGNMQNAAYQQAGLAQQARTEANRVSQQREATDLQRRLLPTTRLARRGTTVQIT